MRRTHSLKLSIANYSKTSAICGHHSAKNAKGNRNPAPSSVEGHTLPLLHSFIPRSKSYAGIKKNDNVSKSGMTGFPICVRMGIYISSATSYVHIQPEMLIFLPKYKASYVKLVVAVGTIELLSSQTLIHYLFCLPVDQRGRYRNFPWRGRRGKDNERDDLCVEDVRQKRRH